ncbi:hypothetical protein ESA94_14045 [Lacibacter luteus]|uniref:Uncharacterized protein n=1 Tax=Lacibacter luteus TaxID=2508719 RepID=A0A4Q1CGH7_9BACT|nr:glycosyltransferase family 39 protein [Lacibacter luteus]RXK59258.1 hypothetical protein ESA94_14045 [Lacibacter luteus]
MNKRAYHIFLSAVGLFFLWYLAQRSAALSMTHDESSTTNVVDGSFTDIMFAANMFGTANNHILNSLLLKFSVQLFGWHEWSIRLPNVLFFLVYYAAAILIVQRITQNRWLQVTGIVLFCTPHFLLDYFSLARGYGMATALEMMSLYFLLLYFAERKQKQLIYSFVLIGLAVYANFTWLNVLLAQWALLNLALLIAEKQKLNILLLKPILKANIIPLVTTVLLVLLIYKPIGYLNSNNEFKWGSETWLTSFHSFAVNLHYTHSYFLLHYDIRIVLLKTVLILLALAAAVLLLQNLFFNKWKNIPVFARYSLITAAGMLAILIISTIVQRHLLNTFYIDGRKALLYLPVLLLLLLSVAVWLFDVYPRFVKSFTGVAATLSILHFAGIFNFYSCFEWWYDASSKKAYQYIVADKNTTPKNTAVNWLFWQSMEFYNKRMFNRQLPPILKTNEISGYNNINYVYVIGDEIRNIPPVFKPVKRYMWDRFLLKRDEAAYRLSAETFILQQQLADTSLRLPLERWQQKADSALLEQRKQLNWNNLLYTE